MQLMKKKHFPFTNQQSQQQQEEIHKNQQSNWKKKIQTNQSKRNHTFVHPNPIQDPKNQNSISNQDVLNKRRIFQFLDGNFLSRFNDLGYYCYYYYSKKKKFRS